MAVANEQALREGRAMRIMKRAHGQLEGQDFVIVRVQARKRE